MATNVAVPSIQTVTPGAGDTVLGVQAGAVKRFSVASILKQAFISTDDYAGSIEAAIAAGVAKGAANIIVDLGEESFFNGVNTSFSAAANTKIITAPNVWLRGKGKPSYSTDSTALVGGSRIKGGLFFAADGFKITDCGVDCGSQYVTANNGGTPIEGLVGVDRGNTGMYGYVSTGPGEDPPKYGLYIDNVCVLSKGTGAAGDTSDVHAALIENYKSGYIGSLETRFGGAGQVIKSSNLQCGILTAGGHFKYSLLFKSEDYADASNNHVDLAILTNFKTLTPDTTTATSPNPDCDTSGLWFQAANADCNNNRVEMLVARGVSDAVVYDALLALKVTSCTVGKMISRDIGGIPVLTRGTGSVIDCAVENMDHDRSLRGPQIASNALRFGFISAVVKNVGRWSYDNSGVDTVLANCRSLFTGIAHARLTAGNVIFMGSFVPDTGSSKPLLEVVAGTSSGLGGVDLGTLGFGTNANGKAITYTGPISGAFAAGDYTSLGMRVRNSTGGGVASGEAMGVEFRAYQPGTGVNQAGLEIWTRSLSSVQVKAAKWDQNGAYTQNVPATAATLTDTRTMTFYWVSNTSLGVKMRGSDSVDRTATITLA